MPLKSVGLLVIFLELITQNYCCEVIKEESQARECLNITDGPVPPPVSLTSHINGNYICNTTKPLYTFFGTPYSTDLIWFFNGELISTFQNGDRTGLSFQTTYPSDITIAIYDITTLLIKINQGDGYRFKKSLSPQMCVSTLTVQPFDDDNFTVIPFNVSCHTHCSDADHTEICESVQYDIAGQPEKPKNLTSKVSMVVTDTKVSSAVVQIDWNPSDDNDTTVISYDLTLTSKFNSNDVIYASLHNSSYTVVVKEGNYTVSVSAVDMCGQVSEPAILEVEVNTSLLTSPCRSQIDAVVALSLFFVLTFIIMTGLIIIIIIWKFCGIKSWQIRGTKRSYDGASAK